eukprot:TRINITY_DN8416_c0_g1_i1.p1 TRINITY_DN8416_c0_g1~~TRINITY_DN8416_c0_g1_i1.p1  ORF type:complete len:272 (-),score=49.92 TRINITY_DN8416_c0_g1_i1:47-862(-)
MVPRYVLGAAARLLHALLALALAQVLSVRASRASGASSALALPLLLLLLKPVTSSAASPAGACGLRSRLEQAGEDFLLEGVSFLQQGRALEPLEERERHESALSTPNATAGAVVAGDGSGPVAAVLAGARRMARRGLQLPDSIFASSVEADYQAGCQDSSTGCRTLAIVLVSVIVVRIAVGRLLGPRSNQAATVISLGVMVWAIVYGWRLGIFDMFFSLAKKQGLPSTANCWLCWGVALYLLVVVIVIAIELVAALRTFILSERAPSSSFQ